MLEEAEQSKSLTGVHDLLARWRHVAHPGLRAPGSYDWLRGRADAISATGQATAGSVARADVRSRIAARLAEAV